MPGHFQFLAFLMPTASCFSHFFIPLPWNIRVEPQCTVTCLRSSSISYSVITSNWSFFSIMKPLLSGPLKSRSKDPTNLPQTSLRVLLVSSLTSALHFLYLMYVVHLQSVNTSYNYTFLTIICFRSSFHVLIDVFFLMRLYPMLFSVVSKIVCFIFNQFSSTLSASV